MVNIAVICKYRRDFDEYFKYPNRHREDIYFHLIQNERDMRCKRFDNYIEFRDAKSLRDYELIIKRLEYCIDPKQQT